MGAPGRTDKLNAKARLKTQPHENQTKLDISKVQKLGNAALDCWWLVGHCEMEIKLNDTDRMLASGVLGHDGLFDQQLAPSLNQIATMRRALVDAKIQDTACVAVSTCAAAWRSKKSWPKWRRPRTS